MEMADISVALQVPVGRRAGRQDGETAFPQQSRAPATTLRHLDRTVKVQDEQMRRVCGKREVVDLMHDLVDDDPLPAAVAAGGDRHQVPAARLPPAHTPPRLYGRGVPP